MRIKQKYMIDFAKGITWLLVLFLINYFNQINNLTAWVYFCLHGSYGIMWVLKSYIFPDKTWESRVGITYALLILVGLILYWAPAYIIPNYFGELLIYLSFVIMVFETVLWWVPAIILTLFIVVVWIPNMIKIDKSLSRFEEHKAYKKNTAFIIPYVL